MTGSYVPKIAMGEPRLDETNYLVRSVSGVKIFYPPGLQAKIGFSEIQIRMKSFLFIKWLEPEGAKAIPVLNG